MSTKPGEESEKEEETLLHQNISIVKDEGKNFKSGPHTAKYGNVKIIARNRVQYEKNRRHFSKCA